MADYGIKVSQEEYDLLKDPDSKQIFNSSWATLNIVDTGLVTTTGGGGIETIATHTLGYIPMYLAYVVTGDSQYVPFDTGISDELLMVGNSTARTFRYYIFDVPLTTAFEATTPDSRTADDVDADRDRQFGIKVSKPGKDVLEATDMRDFTQHSGTRSPMVHIVTQETTTGGLDIPHNLGYPPMVWVYGADPYGSFGAGSYSVGMMNAPGAFFQVSMDSTNVNVYTFSLADWIAVILKDPILVN